MFTIQTSIQILADAERVHDSVSLEADEKVTILLGLRDMIPCGLPGLPASAHLVYSAINRIVKNYGNSRASQEQGRTTKGVEKQAEVAPEGTEETSEAPSGEAEEGPGTPEDVGGAVAQPRATKASSRKTKAKAKT